MNVNAVWTLPLGHCWQHQRLPGTASSLFGQATLHFGSLHPKDQHNPATVRSGPPNGERPIGEWKCVCVHQQKNTQINNNNMSHSFFQNLPKNFFYEGFHLLELPFAEASRNLRSFERYSTPNGVGVWDPPKAEQVKAAEDFVAKITIPDFSPDQFFNPSKFIIPLHTGILYVFVCHQFSVATTLQSGGGSGPGFGHEIIRGGGQQIGHFE
jgi:hypothetical protein